MKNEKDCLVNPLTALVNGSIFDDAEVLEVVVILVEFVPGKFGAEVVIEPAPVEEGEGRGEGVLEGGVVEKGGPELLEADVEEVVEVGDYLVEGRLLVLIEDEGRVERVGGQ